MPEFLHFGDLARVLLFKGEAGEMLALVEDFAREQASSGYTVVLNEGVPEKPFRRTGAAVYDLSESPWTRNEVLG